ncbi:MAG: restriction endonuclease [Sphingobacteriales bacterium]|nr:restriction endonuclease [Sphingobacteriales bacterium]OJW00232.1 MAG: hypothetical protein BGO52_03865 [Sphingobacteriales bacterium 44-61]
MSLEDIRKALQLNKNIIHEDIRAIMKTQEKMNELTSLNQYIDAQKEFLSFMDTGFQETPGLRVIKSVPIYWNEVISSSIIDQSKFQDYSSIFHLTKGAGTWWEEFLVENKGKQLQETEYELTPAIDENDKSIIENPGAILVNDSKRIQEIITNVYNKNTNLLDLGPRQFEELIAELMYRQGFQVELTKQTRDGGYDIVAIYPIKSQAPQKFLVECKRYAEHKKVGVNIVRSFKEVVLSEGANRGIIVTTSYFTNDAKIKIGKTPFLLDYRDKNNIMEWVRDYRTPRH